MVVNNAKPFKLVLEEVNAETRCSFHLGIHNLPEGTAEEIMAALAAYTKNPSAQRALAYIARNRHPVHLPERADYAVTW